MSNRTNPLTTHQNAGIPANSYIKTKDDVEIHSYEDCAAFLGAAKEKVIASNVKIVRLDAKTCGVKLYKTVIITYCSDGTWTASNGGYNTPTTSTRCSQFGPVGVRFAHADKQLIAFGNGVSHRL